MSNGLENVVAAETVLSDVDGLAGRLVIRGLPLDAIAGKLSFEHVLTRLWADMFPAMKDQLQPALGASRAAVFAALATEFASAAALPLFDGMRALLARLTDDDSLDSALRLTAGPAVVLSALLRLKAGDQPLAPDPALGHAADMLRMTSGRQPSAAETAGLDTYLVTVIDHGLNASTFTARVVASTGAGLGSSVLAALGALKGPLHGGAPGPVLDMLDAIRTPEAAETWIQTELQSGARLMGFGHRIYRARDPRADALAGALAQLKAGGGVNARLALAEAIERAALAALVRHKPDRKLETNVEFYTALLLEALGFPRDVFTAVFAAGRIGGWIAHAREQALTGRLIRPQSVYVGPKPQRAA
ncbi:citrate synthase/methylcitrate synthase [Devosia sp.]|uniref:citrate synthase/methylcitrate synthase n=1 Tax=Devosia sp. TaxID=1871048 RepID=UPI003A94CC93